MVKSSIDVAIENELSRSPLNELFCEDSVIAPSVSLGFAGVGIDTLDAAQWPAKVLKLINPADKIKAKYVRVYPSNTRYLDNLRKIYKVVEGALAVARSKGMGPWPA